MALLHSLEICGVRNFSPDDKQTIDFDSPLTLFLGQNGCGKTTIIECISFALTSKLPSESKAEHGFLNDPQMSNKTSTKGSVEIKFTDADGNMITVNRLISVTSKSGGGLTFKNLNKPQDTYYCSTKLNVSKSVLNNVLFCHQENSAWPMSEPQELKKKFDQIFSYTKYNKVVDNTQKIIKEKQTKLAMIAADLSILQRITNEVTAKQNKFNEKKIELTEMKEKIGQIETELEPLEKRKQEILDLEESLTALQTELTSREAERKGLIEQQSTIKKHITYIFKGSDEELQNKKDSFQSERAIEKNAIKELEKKKTEISTEVKESGGNVREKQIHFGQLKEEQNQYRNKLEETNELTERLRLGLELQEFSDVNDRPSVLRELQDALKSLEQKYNTLVKNNEAHELELQQRINEIRERSAGTRQMISFKNNSIVECQNKLKQIRNKLDELDNSHSQLRVVEGEIEKLQAKLTNLKSSFNEARELQNIKELEEEMEKEGQCWDELDKEYRIFLKNYVTVQKLDTEKSLIIEKQAEVARIKNRHSQNLRKLFGEDIPQKNFAKLVQEIQCREENKFKALTMKITKLEKELTHLETTMNHQKKKLENDQKELAFNKKNVSQLCSGKPFNEVLEETHSRKEKLQREKGQLSSGKIMYEAFIKEFEKESPCCPICQTDFASKRSAVSDIITKMKSTIELIPTQLALKESDLKEIEDLYNKLQRLKPINEEIESLTDVKIPKMQEEINDLNERFEEKSSELRAEKGNLDAPQELMEASKDFITDATLLDQHSSDIDKVNAEITLLEQNIIKVASNRSLQETEYEIGIVNDRLSNTKNRYETSKKNLDKYRDTCQNLNNDIQAETQTLIVRQKLVQEKPLLERQDTEYKEELVVLKTEVDELNDLLVGQQGELKNTDHEQRGVIQRNRNIEAEQRSKIEQNKFTLRDIQKLLDSIECYESNKNDSKLDKAVEELEELKIKVEKLEEAMNKVVESISSKKETLAKKVSQLRALNDNIMLRETQKLESKLDSLIEDLKMNMDGYNYEQMHDEKTRNTEDTDKKKQEISSIIGQRGEIQKQVSELEKELGKPENKNAHNNYRKQFYEEVVIKLGIEDLNKFVIVLEKSVLKFHEERMVHINRTIRELWRSIYRGNDIDYIEIKTDENMSGGGDRRRSYDYKVIQVKNNVELEMRSRCSAGQKVLACLVIRMALAETFSPHCGILALDEPTTNLDRENILSLSDTLSRIVTDRERESNFQLLIITHDEEFLRSLTQVQSLDSYWRVKRNQDGFSTVEKHFL